MPFVSNLRIPRRSGCRGCFARMGVGKKPMVSEGGGLGLERAKKKESPAMMAGLSLERVPLEPGWLPGALLLLLDHLMWVRSPIL